MVLKDRWVQAEVNELLERRLSPNPLVTIHKYLGADPLHDRQIAGLFPLEDSTGIDTRLPV